VNEALHRLVDKYGVVNPAARQRTLPPALRTLHRRILRHPATQAMPPPSQLLHEWARDLDVQFDSALAQLAAADLVETEAGSTQLLGAYPFSTTQRGHTVHIQGGPTVHAYCAIDALGIPSMLGADVVITSQDPHTGEPIRVIVTDGQARWQPDTAVVALGIRSDCGRSASRSRCPYITFHGSAETAQIHQQATGRHGPFLTQGQSLTVGTFLFGDLLRGAER
jgi:hypothetical protein